MKIADFIKNSSLAVLTPPLPQSLRGGKVPTISPIMAFGIANYGDSAPGEAGEG